MRTRSSLSSTCDGYPVLDVGGCDEGRTEQSRIEVLDIGIDEVGVVFGVAGARERDEVVRGRKGKWDGLDLYVAGQMCFAVVKSCGLEPLGEDGGLLGSRDRFPIPPMVLNIAI